MKIYLDNNATTALAPSVSEVFVDCIQSCFANPSSVHRPGQEAKARLIKARNLIASILDVPAHEVIFTASATEAANLLLRGIFGFELKGHVISSGLEHAAVYQTLSQLQSAGVDVSFLDTGSWGAVTPEAVSKAITPATRLISLMAANNETGVLTDIEAIAQIAQERKIPFIVDAVALFGKESFRIPKGVSALFFSGHKFHAPKGVGVMVVRKTLPLTPFLTGGDHEYGRRAGTENVAAIAACAEAMRLAHESIHEISSQMRELRDFFEERLKEELPGIVINGQGPRVSNTSNICFGSVDGEALLMYLDMNSIAASLGSACASGALEPSRVLLRMGLERKQAFSSLRFSLSRYTTKDEIEECLRVLIQGARHIR